MLHGRLVHIGLENREMNRLRWSEPSTFVGFDLLVCNAVLGLYCLLTFRVEYGGISSRLSTGRL